MTKEQALKFKEWLTDYVDLDVKVIHSNIRIVCDNVYLLAERGRRVNYRGKYYVVDKFIYEGALRDEFVIHGDRIAKYARLRPDNGVSRITRTQIKFGNVCFNIHSQTKALVKLDEIIQGSGKYLWAEVYYNNGVLHLLVNGRLGEWGWALVRGRKIRSYAGVEYVIVGYRDTKEIDVVDMHCSPVKVGHVYKYCLLEECDD